jgi:hypothetical protein
LYDGHGQPTYVALPGASSLQVEILGREGGELFLLILDGREGAFFSKDTGKSWKRSSRGLTRVQQAKDFGRADFSRVALVDDLPKRRLFVAGFDGLFVVSFEGQGVEGLQWRQVGIDYSGRITGLSLAPDFCDSGRLFLSTYLNGFYESSDFGQTWSNIGFRGAMRDRKHPRVFTAVSVNGGGSGKSAVYTTFVPLYGGWGVLDFGTRELRRVSHKKAISDEVFNKNRVKLKRFHRLGPHLERALLVTSNGFLLRLSEDLKAAEIVSRIELEKLVLFTDSVVIGSQLYIVALDYGGKLFLSRDSGESWEQKALESGMRNCRKVQLAPVSDVTARVFVLCGNGLFVLRKWGDEFQRVQFEGKSFRAVAGLAIHPQFASNGRLLLSVRGQGLFRSIDGGATFSLIANSLFKDGHVFSDTYNPTTMPIVYAPAECSNRVYGYTVEHLFTSTDGGEKWVSLSTPAGDYVADRQ